MSEVVKFSAEIDREVLEGLKTLAAKTQRTLASVVNEAAAQYLARALVGPAFRDTVDDVLERNAELLERLAR